MPKLISRFLEVDVEPKTGGLTLTDRLWGGVIRGLRPVFRWRVDATRREFSPFDPKYARDVLARGPDRIEIDCAPHDAPFRVHLVLELPLEGRLLRISGEIRLREVVDDLQIWPLALRESWATALPGSDGAPLLAWKNGWQSWSPSRSFTATEPDRTASPYSLLRRFTMNPQRPGRPAPGEFFSEYVGVVGNERTAVLLGAREVTHNSPCVEIRLGAPPVATGGPASRNAALQDTPPRLALVPEMPGGVHDVGKYTLPAALVGVSRDPEALLAAWASEVGSGQARPRAETTVGWCSWYRYFTAVTEQHLDQNLPTFRALVGETPAVFQLDDGYQRSVGDWLSWNDKFPSGGPAIAQRIREQGFTPGLWLAPFLVGSNAPIRREHPDWLLRSSRWRKSIGMLNPVWQLRPMRVLDPTHPAVLAWLGDLFHTISREWGYGYLKLDFLYAAALGGRYHREGSTPAAALRGALEVIREAVGPHTLLEGCGCPLGPGLGIFDVMRVAPDADTRWEHPAYRWICDDGVVSTRNAIQNGLYRGFLDGRWWTNLVDCVLLRAHETELTPSQRRSLLVVAALGGGQLVNSDDTLDAEAETAFRFFLPRVPGSAQPLDRLSPGWPTRLVLPLSSSKHGSAPENIWLVALFNWTSQETTVSLDCQQALGVAAAHVTEVLSPEQGYLGRLERIAVPVAPFGVRLFQVAVPLTEPTILASFSHYALSLHRLKGTSWDARAGEYTLSLASPGLAREAFDIVLHLPLGTEVSGLRVSSGNLEVERLGPGLYRLSVQAAEPSKTVLQVAPVGK